MALPFLPGNSFDRNLGKDKFHKSQYFRLDNHLPYLYGDDKNGIGGDPLPGQRIEAPPSVYPNGIGPQLPTWLAFDKQVLSFDAYFQETVTERREEQYRIRRCKVQFYPEDDTIQVLEPRIPNTGLSQGTIIRRHRIAKPPPNNHLFYTIDDFNVGQEFVAYGKTFRLVACDPFTANFLRKMGVRLGEPEPSPDDPYTIHRKAFTESMQPLRPYQRIDKLRQFLDHDRHVLRFFCFWDDTESLYGDPHEMILHYFLADDTIEIREVLPANSGRDGASLFLRRQKLPKGVVPLPLPGTITDRTLLNVMGNIQRGGSYVLDSLRLGEYKEDYYTDRDLTIGASLNVYGRKFLICDCDEFTKEYYRIKYGISDFTPVRPKLPETYLPALRETPPYNGWGKEEDSLANCDSLMPVAPKTDFKKFMEKDKQGLESHILRFHARLVTDDLCERDRLFIISWFLSDDTCSIFEPQRPNSGYTGGLFLERGRIKKPTSERFSVNLPDYYEAKDFYVGAIVEINNFKFELIDADEYALQYMEKHATEFPHSDIGMILDKIRPLVKDRCEELNEFGQRQDPTGTGFFTFDQLVCLLNQITGPDHALSTHEMLTIGRNYSERPPKEIQHDIMVSLAQQQLQKHAFEDFVPLRIACRQQDADRSGELDRKTLRQICMANRLPLPADMLEALMDYSATQSGTIRYELFINHLNWRCHHPNVPCDYTGNLEIDWLPISQRDRPRSLGHTFIPQAEKLNKIRYQHFFDELCGVDNTCN